MDPEEIADAYAREGDVHAAAKRYEEAVVLYDRAIEVFPECNEAWTGKAAALRLAGKLQAALECVEAALQTWPSPETELLRDSLVDEMRQKGMLR